MWTDYLKTFTQYIIPKHALTAFAGLVANVKTPLIKNTIIRRFIRQYDVNMQEALEENPENYPCFNAFFIRPLKPSCRPIESADIISPVDGFISEIGQISKGQLIQAKGKTYTVNELLGSNESISTPFINGFFTTLYLSPKDYHRVHMPLDAVLKEMLHIPGKLFSVQPATTRVIPRLFCQNERLVVLFDTSLGEMAMILVGATIVGRIGTSWHGELPHGSKKTRFIYTQKDAQKTTLLKAEEMGYFKLGSTVILLFSDKQPINWQKELKCGSRIQFGQSLASVK